MIDTERASSRHIPTLVIVNTYPPSQPSQANQPLDDAVKKVETSNLHNDLFHVSQVVSGGSSSTADLEMKAKKT